MESIWLVWLIFASLLGFLIVFIMMENPPPAKKEEKPWTAKAMEIPPNQKWFTKY
jgi:hypothetical protein